MKVHGILLGVIGCALAVIAGGITAGFGFIAGQATMVVIGLIDQRVSGANRP